MQNSVRLLASDLGTFPTQYTCFHPAYLFQKQRFHTSRATAIESANTARGIHAVTARPIPLGSPRGMNTALVKPIPLGAVRFVFQESSLLFSKNLLVLDYTQLKKAEKEEN
jgi:hypothetical protein